MPVKAAIGQGGALYTDSSLSRLPFPEGPFRASPDMVCCPLVFEVERGCWGFFFLVF